MDSETPALGHKCAAYTDVPTDWAKEGICFVIENGLMVGTTSTTFAPKDTLTRAMLVTVLYRMAGSPAVDAPSGFTDVADGQWYSDAIAWAAANGIVNGVGGNKFAPSEPVTREQLAAIFFRYAKAEERLSRCGSHQHLRQRRHGMGRFHGPRYRLEGSGRHLSCPAGPCGPRAGGCHPHALRQGKRIS